MTAHADEDQTSIIASTKTSDKQQRTGNTRLGGRNRDWDKKRRFFKSSCQVCSWSDTYFQLKCSIPLQSLEQTISYPELLTLSLAGERQSCSSQGDFTIKKAQRGIDLAQTKVKPRRQRTRGAKQTDCRGDYKQPQRPSLG